MKIIDAFPFYNELSLLKLHITELYDVVDYFIVVEATKTFAGKDKKLYYDENKKDFEKFHDKIIHIIVNDDRDFTNPYDRENYHRCCINEGMKQINPNDDDLILISDTDEIANCDVLNDLRITGLNEIKIMEMDLYYYNITCKIQGKWDFVKIMDYKNYKRYTPFQIREDLHAYKGVILNSIKNAGWHFSYFGNIDFIINKIESLPSQWVNVDFYKNKDRLKECIESHKHFIFDNIKIEYIDIKDNEFLPKNYKMILQ